MSEISLGSLIVISGFKESIVFVLVPSQNVENCVVRPVW